MRHYNRKIRNLLFDLDGTLTDPAEGITNSLIYALERFGITAERESLYRFIGPPLRETFMKHFNFSPEGAEEAVACYREYFEKRGMFENSLYPGMAVLLEFFKDKGIIMGVATSKPEPYARQIVKHFGLSAYFSFVAGSGMDGSMTSKTELIAYILKNFGLSPLETMMIGDRSYDIEGAVANGLVSAGVTWGFSEEGELEAAGAEFIVKGIDELRSILLEVI